MRALFVLPMLICALALAACAAPAPTNSVAVPDPMAAPPVPGDATAMATPPAAPAQDASAQNALAQATPRSKPAPPMSAPLPPQRVPAAGTAPVKLDTRCKTDADCTVKNVGNCCGEYPSCVNVNSPTDPQAVQAACARSGMMSVCGFKPVSGCECVQGQCRDLVMQVEAQ